MAQITRGTTPKIEVKVDADLTDYTNYLSIGKVGEEIVSAQSTVCEVDDDGSSLLTFKMTQEQTLSLPKGSLKMQVRSIKDDEAIATGLIPVSVADIIKEGVIVDVE